MLRDLYQYYKSTPLNFHNLPLKFNFFLPTYSDHCLFLLDKLSPFIGEKLNCFECVIFYFYFYLANSDNLQCSSMSQRNSVPKKVLQLFTATCVVDLQEIVSFSTV